MNELSERSLVEFRAAGESLVIDPKLCASALELEARVGIAGFLDDPKLDAFKRLNS